MAVNVAFGGWTLRPAPWVKPAQLAPGQRKPAIMDCTFFLDPVFVNV